jgi:PAS domain S-box-containing protein
LTVAIHDEERERLRTVMLENAKSVLAARQRAERALTRTTEALELKSAELARSLALLRATLESTTDAILVTDNAGTVTDCNDNYLKLWRIPAELIQARSHAQLLEFVSAQARDPQGFRDRVREIAEESPPDTFDVLELADGRFLERSSKIQSVDGRDAGRVWSFRDITDRVRAEHEHSYLASIVTSSSDAIASKTLSGIITSWNAAAEQIFGYSAEEAIGQPMAIIIPADRLDEERTILERLGRGESIEHFETVRVTKQGRLLNVSLTISPVRDSTGRIIGVSKIARDITERGQWLAREKAARARAEEASRLKDDFLATVSHELRNPLNAILGWSAVLRTGRIDAEKIAQGLEIIERNARNQSQLIEDLLDVSRIVAGKLRLDVQAVMPTDAVRAAVDSVRLMAEARGVVIHSVIDPTAGPVSGDPARLQQVMWNLLSNAVKFTPKGGRVQVVVERVESHSQIAVSDTGEGIDPSFLPHVFDRFRQENPSTSRPVTGLGVGLAIVRHLVELHGGSVTADSPGRGQGATFIVRLPLRSMHRASPETWVPPTVGSEGEPSLLGGGPRLDGMRVLVVDDESDTRNLLRELLQQAGAEVQEAGSAPQALDRVKAWRPAVMVSDIGMPGEDGYSLIRRVREWEQQVGARIAAIALTAYARHEDRTRALLAGYQAHLAKPVERLELLLLVARSARC